MPDENHTNETPLDQEYDWRKSDEPSDLLFARDSQCSYETFDCRAKIFESITDPLPLNIDLFIRNIDVRLEEHIQVATHIGESFGITCFGKAPMRVTFSGVLADTQNTYGKQYLVDAYKNKLRLGAVARRGKIPVLEFGTHALQGPFLSMRLSESSESEDTVIVVMSMLLTAIQIVGDGKPLHFDYVHGVESENPDDFISNPFGLTGETEEKTSDPEVKAEIPEENVPATPQSAQLDPKYQTPSIPPWRTV